MNEKYKFPDVCAIKQASACEWGGIGFLIYLATWFFLESDQQRSLFYLLLVLPALFLFPRARQIFQTDRLATSAFVLFFAYLAVSACWGEGSFREALKLGLLAFCLLLAVEACIRRFTTEFLADFLMIIGGLAVAFHVLAILLSEGGFSAFANTRFSLDHPYGWGSDNPINSAVVLGLPIVAAWWRFPSRSRSIQAALFLLMLCAFTLMLCTQSRGPILALGATVLLLTLIRHDRSDVLLLCSSCALLGILFLYTNLEEQIQERILEPNYRIHIWKQTWAQFMTHFWVGQGYGHKAEVLLMPGYAVTHAHSFFLEIFRVGGIIGGALFFFLLFAMLDRRVLKPAGLFFLLWLLYGTLCLLSNGRLLLIRPWQIEFFAFWIPLLCLHFSTRLANSDLEEPRSSGETTC